VDAVLVACSRPGLTKVNQNDIYRSRPQGGDKRGWETSARRIQDESLSAERCMLP